MTSLAGWKSSGTVTPGATLPPLCTTPFQRSTVRPPGYHPRLPAGYGGGVFQAPGQFVGQGQIHAQQVAFGVGVYLHAHLVFTAGGEQGEHVAGALCPVMSLYS
jgi:hypothetical protein